MAVKAKVSITISHLIDISSITRYYLAQSSTSAAPAKPTTNPPSSSWVKTEPSYTSGSTNTLYFVDCTEFTNGAFKYSEVSKSSSYEAAKEAYNKAQNAQNTANSAKDFTDKAKNNYGYQYKYDITINGDANTYYPVVFGFGDQRRMREFLVMHDLNDEAPADWNGHPTNHNITLMLKFKCNYGSWGGTNYSWWIHDLEEMYGNVFASAGPCMSGMAFYIFLRGGGETGALYHIYSDQALETNKPEMHATFPMACYNSDCIAWYGGTSDNPTNSWNAPAPRTLTDDIKNEIASKKYIELTSKTETRVTKAETAIDQNKEAITLRATKTEVTTEVTTAINKIEVGGRNLYLGSKDFSGNLWNRYNMNQWSIESEKYKDFTVLSKSTAWGGVYQDISTKKGEMYTISFFAKGTAGSRLASVHRNVAVGNVTTGLELINGNFETDDNWWIASSDATDWKRYWATLEVVADDVTLGWRIENAASNSTVYICGIKLERGNKPTDWTPAPEDIDDNINDTAENVITTLSKTITDHVTAIQTNADSISASVEKLQTTVNDDMNGLREDINTVREKVELQLTEDEVNIQIDKKLQNGVTKVETSTGFKFDENGLNISKSGSSTNTQIDETGMAVNNTETGEKMLTADKNGVEARNLRAETYLIIGGRSRFENYGTNRTGCFWIGE